MHPYLNSRYFDATIISQINGAQMPLFLPFGLVGAPLAGYAFDQTGNYSGALAGIGSDPRYCGGAGAEITRPKSLIRFILGPANICYYAGRLKVT